MLYIIILGREGGEMGGCICIYIGTSGTTLLPLMAMVMNYYGVAQNRLPLFRGCHSRTWFIAVALPVSPFAVHTNQSPSAQIIHSLCIACKVWRFCFYFFIFRWRASSSLGHSNSKSLPVAPSQHDEHKKKIGIIVCALQKSIIATGLSDLFASLFLLIFVLFVLSSIVFNLTPSAPPCRWTQIIHPCIIRSSTVPINQVMSSSIDCALFDNFSDHLPEAWPGLWTVYACIDRFLYNVEHVRRKQQTNTS